MQDNFWSEAVHLNNFALFQIEGDRGDGAQTSASDLHKTTGILFLAMVNQNALGCWNTHKRFAPENFDIVQKDNAKMIYPSDVKVYQDEVIVLTNTMPVFLYRRLNYDEINFRVWINNVHDAVRGTSCEGGRRRPGKPGYNQWQKLHYII